MGTCMYVYVYDVHTMFTYMNLVQLVHHLYVHVHEPRTISTSSAPTVPSTQYPTVVIIGNKHTHAHNGIKRKRE